jgi:hypothetical protein
MRRENGLTTVFCVAMLVSGVVLIHECPTFHRDGSVKAFFYTGGVISGYVLGVMIATSPAVPDVSKDVKLTSSNATTLTCKTTDIQLADHAPSTLRSRFTSPVVSLVVVEVDSRSDSPASSESSWVQMSPPLTLSSSLLADDSLGGQYV